jgi:hypothetical protein
MLIWHYSYEKIDLYTFYLLKEKITKIYNLDQKLLALYYLKKRGNKHFQGQFTKLG